MQYVLVGVGSAPTASPLLTTLVEVPHEPPFASNVIVLVCNVQCAYTVVLTLNTEDAVTFDPPEAEVYQPSNVLLDLLAAGRAPMAEPFLIILDVSLLAPPLALKVIVQASSATKRIPFSDAKVCA